MKSKMTLIVRSIHLHGLDVVEAADVGARHVAEDPLVVEQVPFLVVQEIGLIPKKLLRNFTTVGPR